MGDKNQLVSVIIGTYNRAHIVKRAVESVLRQSHRELEVLVVDDAAVDNTYEVIKSITDPRVVYIRHSKNRGISAVSNTAFSKAKGKFIALLGDDVEWIDEHKLKKQLAVFQSDLTDTLGIVGTWWIENDGERKIIRKPLDPENWPERVLMGGGLISGSSALIKREAWIRVDGFDERQKRGTDSDLFRRIILSGFRATILKTATTAGIKHDGPRMTPKNTSASIDIAISAMKYKIEKLWREYQSFPKALAYNWEKIGMMYAKKSFFDSGFQNWKEMNTYLFKAYVLVKPQKGMLIRTLKYNLLYLFMVFLNVLWGDRNKHKLNRVSFLKKWNLG